MSTYLRLVEPRNENRSVQIRACRLPRTRLIKRIGGRAKQIVAL